MCTDVAARGLDLAAISMVVQVCGDKHLRKICVGCPAAISKVAENLLCSINRDRGDFFHASDDDLV